MLRLILLFLLKNRLWVTRSPKGYQGGIWAPICLDMLQSPCLETPPEPPETLSRALLDPLGSNLLAPLDHSGFRLTRNKDTRGPHRVPKGFPKDFQGKVNHFQGAPKGCQRFQGIHAVADVATTFFHCLGNFDVPVFCKEFGPIILEKLSLKVGDLCALVMAPKTEMASIT